MRNEHVGFASNFGISECKGYITLAVFDYCCRISFFTVHMGHQYLVRIGDGGYNNLFVDFHII